MQADHIDDARPVEEAEIGSFAAIAPKLEQNRRCDRDKRVRAKKMETQVEAFLAEPEASGLGIALEIAGGDKRMGGTLHLRLVESGQGNKVGQPKELVSAPKRLENADHFVK
jgi:hypothetical protein